MELIVEEAKNLQEVSPEELVKQGQEVAEANAKRSPEEIAASFFVQYYPSYKTLMGRLNRKDAVRLADSLVAWPLEVETPKFANKDAHTAFRLGLQLIDCKMVMRNVVEMEYMQSLLDEQSGDMVQSPVENETVTDKGENENG